MPSRLFCTDMTGEHSSPLRDKAIKLHKKQRQRQAAALQQKAIKTHKKIKAGDKLLPYKFYLIYIMRIFSSF